MELCCFVSLNERNHWRLKIFYHITDILCMFYTFRECFTIFILQYFYRSLCQICVILKVLFVYFSEHIRCITLINKFMLYKRLIYEGMLLEITIFFQFICISSLIFLKFSYCIIIVLVENIHFQNFTLKFIEWKTSSLI